MKRLLPGIAIVLLFSPIAEGRQQIAIEMAKIPGGTVQIGSRSGREDERPLHTVTISAFYLGRTPVTTGQFRTFVDETGYRTEAERGDGCVVFTGQGWDKTRGVSWRNPGFIQNDDHPVTCVSWNDAQEFIEWLNERTGKRYRLPTETEWEYAVGRGSDGDVDEVAWTERNSGKSTHPVGLRKPNDFGLFDMIGNVWEWCEDWYGPYPAALQIDPSGPRNGSFRVNRGGAWYGANWECRTRRGKNTPDDRGNGLGFRLALPLIAAEPAKKAPSRDELESTARRMMSSAANCALITLDAHGAPRARTMDPFEPDENFVVWLGTNRKTRKVDEIRRDPRVVLYYFDPESTGYVTLAGIATIVDDKQELAKRWKPEWEAFYPDREATYVLIKVVPEKIELISVRDGIDGDPVTWMPAAIDLDE